MTDRVMRDFTRALRIPILVGRWLTGERMPFGPFALSQLVAFLAVLPPAQYVVAVTAPAGHGLVGRLLNHLIIAPGVAVGTAWAVGKIARGNRNPLEVIASTVTLSLAPRWGTVAGRPVRFPPVPRPVQSRVHADLPHPSVPAPASTSVPASVPASGTEPCSDASRTTVAVPAAAPVAHADEVRVGLSNVGRLLAAAGRGQA